jgi:hypothetical protein
MITLWVLDDSEKTKIHYWSFLPNQLATIIKDLSHRFINGAYFHLDECAFNAMSAPLKKTAIDRAFDQGNAISV